MLIHFVGARVHMSAFASGPVTLFVTSKRLPNKFELGTPLFIILYREGEAECRNVCADNLATKVGVHTILLIW